jgi:hypothetical protein
MNMLYAMVGAVFMVAMVVFAFLKGDRAERIGAGTYLLAWFASILVQRESNDVLALPLGVFLIDLAVLLVFVALAWRSRRSWPVWASGIQLLTVMSHILIIVDLRMPTTSLYTVMNLNGYLIIACLMVGTFWAWQERRAAGLE